MPEIEIRRPDGSTQWVPYTPQAEPTVGQSFWRGLTDAPENLITSFGGIKPLLGIVKNLVAGDREEGLRGVADVSGGIAGGGYGAMAGGALGAAGGPFAPVTVPLGAALGGALGGWVGSLGMDYLVQILRGRKTPTANDAAYALGGAAPYAAASTALGIMNRAGTRGALADSFEAKAIGARSTDFAKSIKQRGIGSDGEIALQEAIKEIGKDGLYKQFAGDPRGLRQAIAGQMDDLSGQMGPEVMRLEKIRSELGKDVAPKWKSATSQVEAMRGSGAYDDAQTKVLNRILAMDSEVDLNTMPGLDQSRKALNKQVYGQSDPNYVNEISDALRQDVRGAQLRAAMELDPNSTLPDLLKQYGYRADVAKKILDRTIAADMVNTPSYRGTFRTTGGLGGAGLASAYTGNPVYFGGAVLADYLLNSPSGQLFVADLLRNKTGAGMPGLVQRGFVPLQQYDQLGE